MILTMQDAMAIAENLRIRGAWRSLLRARSGQEGYHVILHATKDEATRIARAYARQTGATILRDVEPVPRPDVGAPPKDDPVVPEDPQSPETDAK